MNKRILIGAVLCVSLMVNKNLQAQDHLYQWSIGQGYTSDDEALTMDVNNDGSVVIGGYFRNTVDFDPGTGVENKTAVGGRDIFIQKLDSEGNLLWINNFGSSSDDEVISLETDVFGNVYATGYFGNTIDFDPSAGEASLTSSGAADIYVVKYDVDGNYEWAFSLGSGTFSNEFARKIALDSDGNVYVSGYCRGTMDFDPGSGVAEYTAVGGVDVFVMKLDSDGNFIWMNGVGSTGNDESVGMDVSGDNVYVTGYMSSSVDFNPSGTPEVLTSAGGWDVFIWKLDADGNHQWARNFGGTANEYCWSLEADNAGNISYTGTFENTVDFNPGVGTSELTSNGGSDIYLAKMSPDGDLIYAYNFGSAANDGGLGLSFDEYNSTYLTGYFTLSTDFDASAADNILTSEGGSDIFILKIDSLGNHIWAKRMGGSMDDGGIDSKINSEDELFVTGSFRSTADFDPSSGTEELTSLGQRDHFVVKLGECSTDSLWTITECSPYVWPVTGDTYSASGVYYDTISNTMSCDSISILDLTINTVNVGTTSSGITITGDASGTGVTYQWIDCADNSVVSGATSQNFTPEADGEYAVIVNDNDCVDTSVCVTIAGVSLKEENYEIFEVYPNPSNGEVFITTDQVNSVVRIYSIQGNLVFEETLWNQTTAFDLSDLESGVYQVLLIKNNKISQRKLVIQ